MQTIAGMCLSGTTRRRTEMSISTEAVIEALDEIVASKPVDYVYPQQEYGDENLCTYADKDRNPSCIIGHLFAKVDPEFFAVIENYEWADVGKTWPGTDTIRVKPATRGMFALANAEGYPVARQSVTRLLAELQGHQDGGMSWQEAVDIFKNDANDL